MQVNPVIEKELKTKMRGWKAPALITLYLAFLMFVFFLHFAFNNNMYVGRDLTPRIAVNAYNTLAFFQLLLILFITPIITGGAISSERERQTLDLLLCTDFSTLKIILGKIFVSIAHIMLLVTASLPILGIVFIFGGVEIKDILLLFFFYIVVAIMTASIGIFYSTIFKKTIISIVMTYITLGIFVVGTVIFIIIWFELIIGYRGEPEWYQFMVFLFPNPFYGFGSIIENTVSGYGFFSVFVEMANGGRNSVPVKSWVINTGFNIILSCLLILFSARKIRRLK
ncbi:ABC transporter permease [Herbivorax sp. ANBcel31]|uniref:ABC transporter permease n=1 Tax=Herbivorax sp. ANBcel31 TaxID=3069754 RepID=UPI0027B54469|nr:ABC transporter permease [Herbivorax sp. ANBcel31]MDQ2087191.1 ABC transporter permease [Herbivorax sp. ANBcel31]